MKFKELKIGDVFFDEYSGEDFEKVSNTHGKAISSIFDDGIGELDLFTDDDDVVLSQ